MFSTFWNFWNLVLYYPPTSGAMFGFLHFPTEVSAKQSVSNAPKGVPSMRRFWKAMVGHGRIRSFLGYDHFLGAALAVKHFRSFVFSAKLSQLWLPWKTKASLKFLNVVFVMMFVVSFLWVNYDMLWLCGVISVVICGAKSLDVCLKASAHLSHASRQENLATRDLTDTQGETFDFDFQCGSSVIDLFVDLLKFWREVEANPLFKPIPRLRFEQFFDFEVKSRCGIVYSFVMFQGSWYDHDRLELESRPVPLLSEAVSLAYKSVVRLCTFGWTWDLFNKK